jgi:glucan phosphoethanolaminetransferase (alkaline phosphatase superfamily)
MIQRVQTLFLLGLIVCMALLFIFPIWEKVNPDTGTKYALDAFYWMELTENPEGWEVINSKPAYYLAGLAALSCLVALYSIFQFKKRLTQIKLGAVNAFVIMAFVATATYFIYTGENQIGYEARGIFKPGYFLPLGALLFNSLANRFIRKDEKLVRSVDRIR